MNSEVKNLTIEYQKLVETRNNFLKELKLERRKLRELYIERKKFVKARGLLLLFSQFVQEQIKEQIEKMITSALQTVLYDRPYEFKLEFKPRKNRVDCIPVVYSGEGKLIPKEDMGGGSWPVIGFPLRVIFLGNNRPMIWLDEPLKGALGRENDLMLRALRVFRDVSKKLGIQVIINSHEADFMEIADKVFMVKHNGKYSIVKELNSKRRIIKR